MTYLMTRSDMVIAVKAARGLLSEDGENPEYDRAIAELVTELLGLPLNDYSPLVLDALRSEHTTLDIAHWADAMRHREE